MGTSAKILVVEDEMLVAMYVEDCLIEAGFQVKTASDADRAIVAMEADPEIKVVITDIDMPGSMDGLQLARVVRERWPPVALIIASGKHRPEAIQLPDHTIFVPKPFLGDDILRNLRRFPALS